MQLIPGSLGKFEPVSGSSEMDHADEAVDRLIKLGCDGVVGREAAEHALDAVALSGEGALMLDLNVSE